jgi:hypothetical protein
VKHYVVTRNSYPEGYPGLEQRAELLRTYVVPSLRNQLCRDFTWVVTGRSGLEDVDLSGLDTIVLDHPAPADFNSTTYMVQQLVSELAADLPRNEVVITTRLDNDDMLLPHYVEDVQSWADVGRRPLLVDGPGFRVDTRFGVVYRDVHHQPAGVPSPFISLIERTACRGCRLRTAYYDQHTRMHRHFGTTDLERPSWVQLIHSSNMVMSRPPEEVARRGQVVDVDADRFMADVVAGVDLPVPEG